MGIRIKPDSPQLKEWFAKRDAGEISFSQVNILNIASYKLLLPDDYAAATSISKVTCEDKPAQEGVYTLTGIKVKDTNSTDNLPSGIYIINGKKQVIK